MFISPTTGNNAIKEWTAANNTVTTLVASGLIYPARRGGGRRGQCLYRRHLQQRDQEVDGGQQQCDHIGVLGIGLIPVGVAVDGAGNVYIADAMDNAIKEWTAANSNVTTLVSSGLNTPDGVAVDAAGNVYIADTGNGAIKEWMVANSHVTTLVSSGLSRPLTWRWTARAMFTCRHLQRTDREVDRRPATPTATLVSSGLN